MNDDFDYYNIINPWIQTIDTSRICCLAMKTAFFTIDFIARLHFKAIVSPALKRYSASVYWPDWMFLDMFSCQGH
jgi:hypothetical protein